MVGIYTAALRNDIGKSSGAYLVWMDGYLGFGRSGCRVLGFGLSDLGVGDVWCLGIGVLGVQSVGV